MQLYKANKITKDLLLQEVLTNSVQGILICSLCLWWQGSVREYNRQQDRYERQVEQIKNGTFGSRKNLVRERIEEVDLNGVIIYQDVFMGAEEYSYFDLDLDAGAEPGGLEGDFDGDDGGGMDGGGD